MALRLLRAMARDRVTPMPHMPTQPGQSVDTPPQDTAMIRVPTAREYAQLPYLERLRMYDELKNLLREWALTEMDLTPRPNRDD
jgi:hypothetical protein